MMAVSTLLTVVVIAWLSVFLSGRRFGVLGLALAAGSMLGSLWSEQIAHLVTGVTIPPFGMTLASLIPVLLVITPAAVLLVRGPSYRNKKGRLLGATLFTLLALALVAEPLSAVLTLGEFDQMVFSIIEDYRVYIVTAGLVVALYDMMRHRESKSKR